MMNIKQLFLFVFCAFLGFFLSVLLNTKKETVPVARYIDKGSFGYDKSIEKYYNDKYKNDGKWKSVYRGKEWLVVDNVNLTQMGSQRRWWCNLFYL